MHTPRFLEPSVPLHVGSFDPAVSLTEDLPQGVDADILLLGCGDARHILYTSFFDKGLPGRKLDITACDVDEHIIARNVLLFTLLLDGDENISIRQIWNIYYHFHLDDADILVVGSQAKKLVGLSQTLQDWHASSPYGATLRFCDETTLSLVHDIWAKYVDEAQRRDPKDPNHAKPFNDNLFDARIKKLYTRPTMKQDVSRSCAPLSMEIARDLVFATEQHWKKGLAASVALPAAGQHQTPVVPNPIFAVPLATTSALNFPTNPLLSFHLAAAYANLTEASPLRLEEKPGVGLDGHDRLMQIALMQFKNWADAFVEAASRTTIRFTASECFALCYTLRYNIESGATCANHYRSKVSLDLLTLADSEYGPGGKAPRQFDVIDTSTLSDDVSVLNLVISGGPLLKDSPSSTLYTAGRHRMSEQRAQEAEDLISWFTKTNSALLGLVPAEYWTNAKVPATAHQVLTAWSDDKATPEAKDTLFGYRLSWKQTKHVAGHHPIHADMDALVKLAQWIYLAMSSPTVRTRPPSRDEQKTLIPKLSPNLQHTTGTMSAFLRAIADHAQVDSDQLFERFLTSSARFELTLCFLHDHLAAFTIESPTPGFALAESLGWPSPNSQVTPPFKKWKSVPPVLAVTLVIPASLRKNIDAKVKHGNEWRVSVVQVAAHLRIADGEHGRDMIADFSDTQFAFGTVTTLGDDDQDDYTIRVVEDKAGWKGDSPLFISFYAPTEYVEAAFTEGVASFHILVRSLNSDGYQQVNIGGGSCWEKPLSDREVLITKYRPGETGYPISEGALRRLKKSRTPADTASPEQSFRAEFSTETVATTAITGRINITSEEGKKLLIDKAPIKLEQPSPFTLDIVFGKKALILPLTFPAPILKDGSKTRIARTSHYIEITAPLANPSTFPRPLDDFLFPTTLTFSSSTIPSTFNLPHLNLDTLPILSVADKSRTRFLTTLSSLMFSSRERRLREEFSASSAENNNNPTAGLSPSPRLNFKESLFTLFMLASGLQGGQTGLFALSHPQRGGIHMLLFVSAIRLDGAHGSVVLDAAILPFTREIVQSKVLEGFLLVLRTLECCTLTVDDAELEMWKKVLPALAERCRDWVHDPEGCEYVKKGSVPVSLKEGEKVLCGCGMGKLPEEFVSLPEWETAAGYATRVAISPVYASALVEELIAPELARAVAEEMAGKVVLKCRNCGRAESEEVKLKKCMRCLEAVYCSAECQKKDWKKHRMECEESEEYHK